MKPLIIGPRCQPPPTLVHPVPIDPLGTTGPTRSAARSSRWRRTSKGLYVAADVDGSVVEQRIVEQSARTLNRGLVTAWAALRLFGAGYFDGRDPTGTQNLPVPMLVRTDISSDPEAWFCRDHVPAWERTTRCGVRVTVPERALFDEMRRRGQLRAAVMAADMAFASGACSPAMMADFVATKNARTGVPLIRQALDLSRDGSASPYETRMRLIWMLDAGFPDPLLNPDVFDLSGEFIGRPDLLDPVAGVVGEYDGEYHRSAEQHRRDVQREERFRDAGLEYFTVVAREPVDLVIARMRRARRKAGWLEPDQRRWCLRDTALPGARIWAS